MRLLSLREVGAERAARCNEADYQQTVLLALAITATLSIQYLLFTVSGAHEESRMLDLILNKPIWESVPRVVLTGTTALRFAP